MTEQKRKTAKEYWIEKFGEEPQSDSDKLAIVMMREYVNYLASQQPEIVIGKSAEEMVNCFNRDYPDDDNMGDDDKENVGSIFDVYKKAWDSCIASQPKKDEQINGIATIEPIEGKIGGTFYVINLNGKYLAQTMPIEKAEFICDLINKSSQPTASFNWLSDEEIDKLYPMEEGDFSMNMVASERRRAAKDTQSKLKQRSIPYSPNGGNVDPVELMRWIPVEEMHFIDIIKNDATGYEYIQNDNCPNEPFLVAIETNKGWDIERVILGEYGLEVVCEDDTQNYDSWSPCEVTHWMKIIPPTTLH